jgi:hypothetical protein
MGTIDNVSGLTLSVIWCVSRHHTAHVWTVGYIGPCQQAYLVSYMSCEQAPYCWCINSWVYWTLSAGLPCQLYLVWAGTILLMYWTLSADLPCQLYGIWAGTILLMYSQCGILDLVRRLTLSVIWHVSRHRTVDVWTVGILDLVSRLTLSVIWCVSWHHTADVW